MVSLKKDNKRIIIIILLLSLIFIKINGLNSFKVVKNIKLYAENEILDNNNIANLTLISDDNINYLRILTYKSNDYIYIYCFKKGRILNLYNPIIYFIKNTSDLNNWEHYVIEDSTYNNSFKIRYISELGEMELVEESNEFIFNFSIIYLLILILLLFVTIFKYT